MVRITVNMATIPSRIEGFARRLLELAPQCDLMRVYLNNGYTGWPSDIERPSNVGYICAGVNGVAELGSQGKLFWVDPTVNEYYCTVDDDIYYPKNYIQRIVEECWSFRNNAVVAFHGYVFATDKFGRLLAGDNPRNNLKLNTAFMQKNFKDVALHLPGNGVMCCHPMALNMNKTDLVKGPLHSGDDEDVAIWCQKNKVPIVSVKKYSRWLRSDEEVRSFDAQCLNTKCSDLQSAKLRGWKDWITHPIPKCFYED